MAMVLVDRGWEMDEGGGQGGEGPCFLPPPCTGRGFVSTANTAFAFRQEARASASGSTSLEGCSTLRPHVRIRLGYVLDSSALNSMVVPKQQASASGSLLPASDDREEGNEPKAGEGEERVPWGPGFLSDFSRVRPWLYSSPSAVCLYGCSQRPLLRLYPRVGKFCPGFSSASGGTHALRFGSLVSHSLLPLFLSYHLFSLRGYHISVGAAREGGNGGRHDKQVGLSSFGCLGRSRSCLHFRSAPALPSRGPVGGFSPFHGCPSVRSWLHLSTPVSAIGLGYFVSASRFGHWPMPFHVGIWLRPRLPQHLSCPGSSTQQWRQAQHL